MRHRSCRRKNGLRFTGFAVSVGVFLEIAAYHLVEGVCADEIVHVVFQRVPGSSSVIERVAELRGYVRVVEYLLVHLPAGCPLRGAEHMALVAPAARRFGRVLDVGRDVRVFMVGISPA